MHESSSSKIHPYLKQFEDISKRVTGDKQKVIDLNLCGMYDILKAGILGYVLKSKIKVRVLFCDSQNVYLKHVH